MNPLILELLDYHAWANERLLQHVSALPEGVFTAHVNNVFSSVAETFGHIAAVDEAWLSRMNGISPRAVETKRFANVQEAQDHFNDLHARIRRFLSGQDDPEKIIVYNNTKGERLENSIAEIARHIVNHGTYHRGNIASMIRQLGHAGVSTDYIVYTRWRKDR